MQIIQTNSGIAYKPEKSAYLINEINFLYTCLFNCFQQLSI